MEERLNKFDTRKITQIFGMHSVGKSKLINVILNIIFLESDSNITTKFVNILKYKPEIMEPIFYRLKFHEENKDYIFYKDPSYKTKKGDKVLIEENKNID